ncbi:MAG: Gfo/Idh/MocA family oxidoreductase [Balneolaceae bacterium]
MSDQKNAKDPVSSSSLSRKHFIGQAAALTAGFMIVPRHVLGGRGYKAPSDKLNVACVGVGGMGGGDTRSIHELGENIYALCDVDWDYAAQTLGTYPDAKKYFDFREMLDNEKEIDAVVVSTPDNNHAAIAIYAMQLGKHVYVQKPLTRTIYESRRMAQVARETGVKTQMGNQGHAREGTQKIVEWVRQGAIGEIRKVDCWTNRPRGYWPQGASVSYPQEIPAVPGTMKSWDLWIGPSPYRPYHPAYAPFRWRGWWDFGSGALGDMGAHIMDQPYWALDLGFPSTVHASSTPFNNAAFPLGSTVHYEFPGRNGNPPVDLNWYDGGIMPPRPDGLEEGKQMGASGGGMIFYGSNGTLMADVYGDNPRFIPESDLQRIGEPRQTITRSPGIYAEWIHAIKEDGETTSHFDYAAALTETMLLGNVAVRFSDQNQKLEYDAENMRFTNLDAANNWLEGRKNELRPGWKELIG